MAQSTRPTTTTPARPTASASRPAPGPVGNTVAPPAPAPPAPTHAPPHAPPHAPTPPVARPVVQYPQLVTDRNLIDSLRLIYQTAQRHEPLPHGAVLNEDLIKALEEAGSIAEKAVKAYRP